MPRNPNITIHPAYATVFSKAKAAKFEKEYEDFLQRENVSIHAYCEYDGGYIIKLHSSDTEEFVGFFTDRKPKEVVISKGLLKAVDEKLKVAFSVFLSFAISVFGFSGVEGVSDNPAFTLGIIMLVLSMSAIVFSLKHDIDSQFLEHDLDKYLAVRVKMIKKIYFALVAFALSVICVVFSLAAHLLANTTEPSLWGIECDSKFLNNLLPFLSKSDP